MEKESDSKGQQDGNGDDVKPSNRPRRERKEVVPAAEEKPQNNAADESLQNDDSKQRRRRTAGSVEETDKAAENGGWMNMNASENKFVPKKSLDEGTEVIPQALNKDKHFQENDDDIMLIPDLDEDGADADQRIAHAPRNINRKIPTLADLENEVKSAVTSADSGFDLGVLLSTLVPVALLAEADVAWTFESLLRDVTDELTATDKTVTETSVKPTVATVTGGAGAGAGTGGEKPRVILKSNLPSSKAQLQEMARTGK